jgi:hypothetical protein
MDSKGDVKRSSASDADDHVVEQRIMGDSHTSDSAGFELFGLLWGAMVGGAVGYRAFGWVGGIGGGYIGVVVSQVCSQLPRLRQYNVYTLFTAFESWGLTLGLGFSYSPSVRSAWPARIGVMILSGLAGWCCGWVPSLIITLCRRRTLSRETTDALKARLRNGASTWYQLVMRELQKRGADLRGELPLGSRCSLLTGPSRGCTDGRCYGSSFLTWQGRFQITIRRKRQRTAGPRLLALARRQPE